MEKNKWFTDEELERYSDKGILSEEAVKQLRDSREKDKKKKSSMSP